jgi:hypothetical protein
MKKNSIALLIFGEPGSTRNALTEEKYKKLAAHFIEKGFEVDSFYTMIPYPANLPKSF